MVDSVTNNIPSIESAQASLTKSQSALENANLTFDTFLKLLTAQLENQDPLNPLDGTQFTEQIAAFSGLEQQIQTNSHLENLVAERSFNQQAMAVGFIGKEVLAPGNKAQLLSGSAEVQYELDARSAVTVIEVFDADGAPVKVIEGETKAGIHDLVWDGRNELGEPQPDGEYQFVISSFDADGNEVDSNMLVYNPVTAIRTDDNGQVFLELDRLNEILLDEAFTVREPKSDS